MSKVHGREFGVQQYDMLCDKLGIMPESRINPELTDDEIEELEELAEEKKQDKLEKSDSVRETIIAGFRLKLLEIGEGEIDVIQKLQFPIKHKTGDQIILDKLEWRERYTSFELENAAKGIDFQKNQLGAGTALMSVRTKRARGLIGKVTNRDNKYCLAINSLFEVAGSPIF